MPNRNTDNTDAARERLLRELIYIVHEFVIEDGTITPGMWAEAREFVNYTQPVWDEYRRWYGPVVDEIMGAR